MNERQRRDWNRVLAASLLGTIVAAGAGFLASRNETPQQPTPANQPSPHLESTDTPTAQTPEFMLGVTPEIRRAPAPQVTPRS